MELLWSCVSLYMLRVGRWIHSLNALWIMDMGNLLMLRAGWASLCSFEHAMSVRPACCVRHHCLHISVIAAASSAVLATVMPRNLLLYATYAA